MRYDFSKFFENISDDIFDLFIDKYTSQLSFEDAQPSQIYNHYKNTLLILEKEFEEDSFIQEFKIIASENSINNVPYIVTINEIYNLKTLLVQKMVHDTTNTNIILLLELFKKVTRIVSQIFLLDYINKILSQNNVRINSLKDLMDKKIIRYYEAHLIWVNDLVKVIQNNNKFFIPELDPSMCEFGRWLDKDAKKIIQNNSKYKAITLLHNNLHLFGKKIKSAMEFGEHDVIMTYLEKCEFLSLSIGTELALLDNIVMNKKITKDKLTGALNRQALENVFESQYELSLATNNQFVLAMCDLDDFKLVNDTYGHLAGDKILKLFVNIVQKNIRNSDLIIRYGGEEFIIILPSINEGKGLEVLNKIRMEFEKSKVTIKNQEVRTTVSIGMMEITPKKYYETLFLDEYIDIVDQKLYQAKSNGRNRIEVF